MIETFDKELPKDVRKWPGFAAVLHNGDRLGTIATGAEHPDAKMIMPLLPYWGQNAR